MRNKSRSRRFAVWTMVGLVLCAIGYGFPLLRVVPLRLKSFAVTFQAPAYAVEFWEQRLMKAANQASDVNEVLAAVRLDSRAARGRYGRTSGLGGPVYYFVSGTGKVIRRDKGAVTIHPDGGVADETMFIDTGAIFGNGVRDGTGLLNVNDFPNSRDFNQLAEELNKLVEVRVLPALREASLGSTLHFAGIAEVSQDAPASEPWHLVPVIAEVR